MKQCVGELVLLPSTTGTTRNYPSCDLSRVSADKHGGAAHASMLASQRALVRGAVLVHSTVDTYGGLSHKLSLTSAMGWKRINPFARVRTMHVRDEA